MDIERDVQIVIAGAGPVGLMLAAELRLAGLEVLVVEQRPVGTVGQSRAVGLNARSFEVFRQRGLADEALESGRAMPAVLFAGLFMNPSKFDPEWPGALRLPQYETERILTEWTTSLGVQFLWSTGVAGMEQDADGVTVQLEGDAAGSTVRAAYLVGCDGGRSAVRRAAGIDFPGVAGEDWWVVGDLDLASPPEGMAAFGRNDRIGFYQVSQAEQHWYRLTVMRRTPPADPASPVTLEEIREVMLDGLGTDYGLRGAKWMSRWTDGFRQAAAYRDGRVLLAGDAAHTHPPIGGQGLNVGLQDAVNLGWKLGAVLRGDQPDSFLDTYQQERHPVEEVATELSLAQTELVKPGRRRDAIRSVFSDLIEVPDACLRLAGELSGLTLRYPLGDGHPLTGRRLPDLPLIVDGARTTVFELLRTARPLLIELGDTQLAEETREWDDVLVSVRAQYLPEMRGDRWYFPVLGAVPPFDAVLVRPDGYVAWTGPDAAPDRAGLMAALTAWVRPARA